MSEGEQDTGMNDFEAAMWITALLAATLLLSIVAVFIAEITSEEENTMKKVRPIELMEALNTYQEQKWDLQEQKKLLVAAEEAVEATEDWFEENESTAGERTLREAKAGLFSQRSDVVDGKTAKLAIMDAKEETKAIVSKEIFALNVDGKWPIPNALKIVALEIVEVLDVKIPNIHVLWHLTNVLCEVADETMD